MIFFIVGFSLHVFFQFLALTILLHYFWKDHSSKSRSLKQVSVIVTSRNEEFHLPDLLQSLGELDYPNDMIDFWMADDHSEDSTATILRDWCAKEPNRFFVPIKPEEVRKYHRNGKANALSILTSKAKGEIFFLTDADCVVPKSWIYEGVHSFSEKMDMLLGVTQVMSETAFGKFQEVDWWHTLGIVKVINDLNLGLTGLGNNMMVRRTSLQRVGGFENLPDSLTEDLALSRAIIKKGGQISQQVSPEVLAETKAEETWKEFLRQRKRWISGVVTLPWYCQVLLGLEFLFYPAVFALIWIDPFFGVPLWVLKVLMQSIFMISFASRAGKKVRLAYLLLFDFYQLFSALISFLYYFWPSKIDWKSRTYP